MPLAPGGSWVRVGDQSLEYRFWGADTQDAPTLVMLHEGLGSVGLWRDFPGQLAKATGLGVMAYSRAGYGASDAIPLPRPLDYMTREAQYVLTKVLSDLGIERPILLGHSDGATIAALYAAIFDVRGVILIAPHFFTEPAGLSEITRAREQFEEGDLRARLSRHHADPDCAFRGWNDAWLDPGFRDWNVTGSLDDITAPVLAIQGGDDPYGTIAHVEEVERRASAPVEVLLLPGCGHAPHVEAPHIILPAIAAFVDRVGGQS